LPRRLRGLLLASASGALLLVAPPDADAAPVSTSPPTISGTLEPGQTLTATTGAWTDATSPIVSYAYQWLRCLQYECTDIDYATSPTYTMTDADDGEQLEVAVIATDAEGESTPATSAMTFVIDYEGPSYTLGEGVVGDGSVTGFDASPEAAGRTADANLACPGSCGVLYPYLPGTQVELVATPAPGSAFLGWGGACAGSAPTCSLTLGADESVTASFTGQGASAPVLPLEYEGAGGWQPPAAGPPAMGAWEPPAGSAAGPAARLLGIRYARRHVQAEVQCEQASPCHLSLAILAGAPGAQAVIARRSFAVPARRGARVSLALDRWGARLLARRHRLPVTARLALGGAGRVAVVEQGRFTLAG